MEWRNKHGEMVPRWLEYADPAIIALAEPIIETVEYWISAGVKPKDVADSIDITEVEWPAIELRLALEYARELGVRISHRDRNRMLELFFYTLPNGG